jgi:hypothetical protein
VEFLPNGEEPAHVEQVTVERDDLIALRVRISAE